MGGGDEGSAFRGVDSQFSCLGMGFDPDSWLGF